jgi:acid phosphatase type 7
MSMSKAARLLALLLCCLFVQQSLAKTARFRAMWRDDPSTTMVIGWDQYSGSAPLFFYDDVDRGLAVQQYRNKRKADFVMAARGLNNHFVRLTGLKPGTVYYFVIVDSEGISRRYSFRTIPCEPSERLCFISGGDSRNNRDVRIKANQLVSKIRPHFICFNGDMTAGDTGPEWRDWLDDWQSTISQDGRIHPIVVARGNHELDNRSLQEIFDIPFAEAFYAFSFGGNLIRLVTLNTMASTVGDQKTWLERELNNDKNFVWRIAQYHHAMRPHTTDKPERDDLVQNWAPIFFAHSLDLALESDSHVAKVTWPIRLSRETGSDEGFIRDDNRGTVYLGEGCWGAPLRNNNDDKNWTRNSGSFNHFNLLFVDQDRIEIRTVLTDQHTDLAESKSPFVLPIGLKLWQPSNGSLVSLKSRKFTPVSTNVTPGQAVVASTGKTPKPNAADVGAAEANEKEWAKFPACGVDANSGDLLVTFQTATLSNVSIILFNSFRRELSRQEFPNLAAGRYTKRLPLRPLPPGRYLVTVRANDKALTFYQYSKAGPLPEGRN